MDVEKVFENVTGRKMTPNEVTRYLKFQKEFEVPDTDPTWMLFVWFEFYQRIFEEVPTKTAQETEKVIRSLREASVKVSEATSAEIKKTREGATLEIAKMAESTKATIAAALSDTLETEIRYAVNRLSSQANRPMRRKWIAIFAVGLLIFASLGGRETWSFYQYAHGVGEADGVEKANPVFRSFDRFIQCDNPGWEAKWDKDGKELWCFPFSNPKDRKTYGWRIR